MFDQAKADRTLAFLRNLKHTTGEWHGRKFTMLSWQETFVADVFGTVKPNGYRQYTTAYLEIPKKNGKTELAAGIGLYLTCADDEYGAEVYGAASNKAQASLAFDVAVDMVDQSAAMKKYIKLNLSARRMTYRPTNSFYQVLSADSRGKQGYNVHGVVFDELHEQPNRRLYDTLTFGSGDARRQPLFLFMTTAGDDPDRTSICWQVHKKAERILEHPEMDPTFYPVVYGIADDADPADEANWYKANPSLGHTVSIEKVREAWVKAQMDPGEERKFRQFRLNQWVKDKVTAWLKLSDWDLNIGDPVDLEQFRGRLAFDGIDMSSKIDITAHATIIPPINEDPYWHVFVRLWMPEDRVEEAEKRDNVPYSKWIAQGFMRTVPGNVIDDRLVEQSVLESRDFFDLKECGFDPWNAVQLALRLQEAGVTMVEVRQGYKSMSPAMKEIEALVLQKRLHHSGHPVLRWMAGNTNVRRDENDNLRPVKQQATGRIDGVVAAINAMACAIFHVKPQDSSGPETAESEGGKAKVW